MIHEIAYKLLWIGNQVAYQSYSCLSSKHKQVVNFLAEGMVLSVCAKTHCPGPYRIILDVDEVDFIQSIKLTPEYLQINGDHCIEFTPQHIWQCPDLKTLHISLLTKNTLNRCHFAFLSGAPSNCVSNLILGQASHSNSFEKVLAQEFRQGMKLLREESWEKGVQCFKGKGMGLTPAGDDFLTGLIIGMAWLEDTQKKELSKITEIIYGESFGSDALLNTFLWQARTLQLDADWAMFLSSLANADEIASLTEQRIIMSHGATSGADKLSGFYAAMAMYGNVIDIGI